MFFNTQSFVNKISQLKVLLHSQGLIFILLLKLCWNCFMVILFSLKLLYFYCILRCDNLDDRGGAICVIYEASLGPKISRLQTNAKSCSLFEITTFEFYYSKSKFCRFIYRQTSKTNDGVTVKVLLKILKSVVFPE